MIAVNKSDQFPYCKILGIGHSEPSDSDQFEIISQIDFIKSLPIEKQNEITKNGELSIEEVATNWGEMISEKRTFFKGDIGKLGLFAVNRLWENLEKQGIDRKSIQIDAIIGATNTGPNYPSLADTVKNEIGIRDWSMCYDVTEACTSGSVAIMNGYSLIKSKLCKNVLVVCAEKATTLTSYENWQGSNLFGDASFAVLLTASDNVEDDSLKFFSLESFPFNGNLQLIRKIETGFVQEGKKVHVFVVRKVVEELINAIKIANIDISEIKHLVFHQPSRKTITSMESYLTAEMPDFKGSFHYSKDVGNASSASFGHLLSKKYLEGEIKKDELVITCTFGAGLSIAIIGLKF